MNRRLRVLFAGAALTGVWSGWIQYGPGRSNAAVVGAVAPRPAAAARASAAPLDQTLPIAKVLAAPARMALDPRSLHDAFATRSWQPPPPPPPPAPPPVAHVPPPPPPPPPPPTLPYRFVGLLDDPQADKPRVFLAVGDKLIVASPGDVLEGGFVLEHIGAHELDFLHVQRGVKVRLAVSGAAS